MSTLLACVGAYVEHIPPVCIINTIHAIFSRALPSLASPTLVFHTMGNQTSFPPLEGDNGQLSHLTRENRRLRGFFQAS